MPPDGSALHAYSPARPKSARSTSQVSTISVAAQTTAPSQFGHDARGTFDIPNPAVRNPTTHAKDSSGRTSSLIGHSDDTVDFRSGSQGSLGRGIDTSAINISSSSSSRYENNGIPVMDIEDVRGDVNVPPGDARKGLMEIVRRDALGEGAKSLSRPVRLNKGNYISLQGPTTACYQPRQYYVLTNAGKPVYYSEGEVSNDAVINLMGVAQALISIVAEDGDRMRCILKGRHQIAFLLKSPLYLFCVSDWGEPEHVLRSHLEYIHLHILSVVTSTQLTRAFQRRSNFDLSKLLDGTSHFLTNLITAAQNDFTYLTSTLQPLRMPPAIRDTCAAALMPPSKFRDLLYVLLIANNHIVTVLRPRKHSIHPSDLHLLLNTLASSSTLRSTETWFPMCFPKFNPAGFVHSYINFMTEDIGLVFVSADQEAFEDLQKWKDLVVEKLQHNGLLAQIQDAIPSHPYTISTVGCPGLLHFVYKSRQHIQITQPTWEAPYNNDSIDHKRLVTMYQTLHDTIHSRSGQDMPVKLVCIQSDHEKCLAWATKPFELYMTVSPQLSNSALVATANKVARWVLSDENQIFLKDAPVF
ncbi:hypothetical protein L202_06607 [Cryptococcus amylolentus CBS 6039]|uniref:Vacuolar fusion protein MON1 n=2 Tax=Cryptococcus amylolentus CBS 6039 TaxID=1295533 RepID=A0A1E3HGK3_9TREE|nr:hypothetical protein L202_06607 [Cryptococcus amylolentus CBS 6039]ODN75472.1 hypothetical protein L202_06607 [Cryptococcus amylolentus CBS 6039]